MPIKVTCPACSSRFSLGDDLYRRRVAGSLVKVKCRYCKAEIAVDATDPATMPNHEPQRKHPIPPRPKAVTQLGLGTPPATAELATASPLPLELAHSGLPLNATVTPLPINAAAITPHAIADADMSWNDEPTLAINLANVKPPPKPPARSASVAATDDPELIDAEEIPPSSSDAPTLDALTLEAGGAHVPHGKPPPDEFLVSLSAGGDNSLGAPTIDVTSFAAEIDPPTADLPPEEQELEYRPARSNTVPLYDMGAVLAAAGQDASADRVPAKAAQAPAILSPEAPLSEGRARERKYVIAPEAEAQAAAPKARRARPMLWVALLAAAGAAGVAVGLYERHSEQLASNESEQLASPLPAPVVNTESALPAEAPTAEGSEAASAAPTASDVAPAATAAMVATGAAAATTVTGTPAAQNVVAGTNRSVAPHTTAAVKSSASTTGSGTEQAKSAHEPAVEKPTTADKQFEARNAPPPAAPDTEFDRTAARNALASAASQASSCRKEGDPSGTANLTITFAPSGRVTSAQIQGPPFSGTPTGGCIASTMRRASVPAFSGDYVTVSKTIVVQ